MQGWERAEIGGNISSDVFNAGNNTSGQVGYIYIYYIYTLLVFVFVCLYPLNVKTAEPIEP